MKTYQVINLEQPESGTAPFAEDRHRQFHGFPVLNFYGSYLMMGNEF